MCVLATGLPPTATLDLTIFFHCLPNPYIEEGKLSLEKFWWKEPDWSNMESDRPEYEYIVPEFSNYEGVVGVNKHQPTSFVSSADCE
jgi:hypothetical protein